MRTSTVTQRYAQNPKWWHLLADKRHSEAMSRYNARYNNAVYVRATDGMSCTHQFRLQDDALALCGSPYYSVSRMRWGEEATAFLALFGD